MKVDVAIIGGGPAGSTAGALLKKYDPSLNVLILEREVFPRDHVGESHTPPISHILDEMGCWQDVENAGFPIKIGATYCWGKTRDLWDFDFVPPHLCNSIQRPGKFEGIRRELAFQVDRAIYDEILLNRAQALGCDVRQNSRVSKVSVKGDEVVGLSVDGIDGEIIADTYLDCSGHAGVLRRAVNVEIECPTNLRNVAVWEYWRNAKWAEEIGVGATRVQVMSVGYGWIWFIPLGPDRTSVGLVLPTEYLKRSGVTLAELYSKALAEQPFIVPLMVDAVPEGQIYTTKDWSFVAKKQCGTNWYLVGESSGFADPILAAGLTITHAAGREAAYSILEERRGADPAWLRESYENRQHRRLRSHIRFADYWYTANSQFTDLKEHTAEIAKEAGLSLSPEEAWRWLSQGGFIDEDLTAGLAGFALPLLREMSDYLGEENTTLVVARTNVFRPNLDGATQEVRAEYKNGRVLPVSCLVKDGKIWPMGGRYEFWYKVLTEFTSIADIILELRCQAEKCNPRDQRSELYQLVVALEALISDGWVEASYDPSQPLIGKIHFKNFQWHGDSSIVSKA
jgi:flavin-dependent dehydrogenase